MRLRRQEWYQKTKDERQEKQKKYYLENYDLSLLNSIRQRAKRLGAPFDLTRDDLIFPEKCPVFGFALERNRGKVNFNSPSIDRIDPSRGYTKDNIQVISYKANTMKNNASKEELEMFARWILKENK